MSLPFTYHACSLPQSCTDRANNPKTQQPEHDAEGGSSTGLFVVPELLADGTVLVHGAALGDSVAFHIDRRTSLATQLNTYARRNHSARDPGGALSMCMGLDGNVVAFSRPAAPNDLVVLASDGLTDNMDPAAQCEIVSLVLRAALFNAVPDTYCEATVGPAPHLPSYAELERAVVVQAVDDLAGVSVATAARRLTNYVKWVTRNVYELEQTYFGQQWRLQEIMRLKPADRGVFDHEAQTIKDLLRTMEASRGEVKAGKSDDCMVVVLQVLA